MWATFFRIFWRMVSQGSFCRLLFCRLLYMGTRNSLDCEVSSSFGKKTICKNILVKKLSCTETWGLLLANKFVKIENFYRFPQNAKKRKKTKRANFKFWHTTTNWWQNSSCRIINKKITFIKKFLKSFHVQNGLKSSS